MALRKLQAEIDRTLKAVAQGVEVFEATFDKLNHSSNATQKDKLETDLKTQIKKLQRMRDQIKVWLGSSDIKDKSALLDNRKLIETQMERFKALEKEMKMKAFSKEGLIAAARLDPAEKARRDMLDWIGTTVEELSRQIEQTEAEQEQLQSVKKKKSTSDRLSELDQLNERRQWHIGRLEIVQRMFENGQINLEQVESIQEDVKYFVEANTEEDFDYDTGIYDELNLQDVEEEYIGDYPHHEDTSTLDSTSVADVQESKTPLKEDKKSRSSHRSQTGEDDAPSSPILTKRLKTEKEEKERAKAAAAAAKAAAETTPPPQPETSVPVPKAAPLPPIRYAAAAAAAVGALPETTPPARSKDSLPSPPPEEQPSLHDESTDSPPSEHQSNGHAPPPPPGISRSPSPSPSPAPSEPLNGQQPLFHAESSRAPSYPRPASKEGQGVLESLMDSFHSAKELAERHDPNELSNALDQSFQNVPAQVDAEPPRYYHPSNPIQTPSYYPQARLPALEDKAIYQRLELDQLFYIFYYMTGTYEQWLAAQELKRQSWRFHKQYLTWFQRAHNPQAITEDYEQGGYYYFDWENSWCQRRKSDFRFEYRWLSDH